MNGLRIPTTGLAALHQAVRSRDRTMPLLTRLYVSPTNQPKPPPMMEEAVGQSGRRYSVQKILQDKTIPFGRVYLANSHGTKSYVLKEIPQDLQIRLNIYSRASSCPHVRKVSDIIPGKQILVFDHLNENMLQLTQKDLPISTTKHILKQALRGLVALHNQDIVHIDIKANNISVQTKESGRGIDIDRVELDDLEDATHLLPGSAIMGAQLGNWMWRSPEAHAEGPIERPSDMFSFGIVCIYAITKALVLAVDEAELEEGVDKLAIVLQRQISYLADQEGFNGLLRYLGNENPWKEIFQVVKQEFGEEQPRKPVALWEGYNLDADFKDLIGGMTDFDSERRLTAEQALLHRWFE